MLTPFSEWWLRLRIPAVLRTREQWDAVHSIAKKAYYAGRKYERENRRKP